MTSTQRALATAVAVLIVATLVAAPVVAQEWKGRGRVKVVVAEEGTAKPIAGATVLIRSPLDRNVGPPPGTTDKKGKFSMLGLRDGTWLLRIEARGYEPHEDELEVFGQGAPETEKVFLKPLPEEVIQAQQRVEAQDKLDRARECLARGDVEGARTEYEKALADLEEVDHPVVLNALASTYVNDGNLDQARTILDRSLAINPGHVDSLRTMCAILASQGQVVEAEATLAKIPEATVVHPNTLMNIGMTHYNEGEMDQAKVFLDRAVRDHPGNAQAHYFRGLICLSLDDQEQATADFERFLELAPDHPQAAEAKEYLGYLKGTAGGG